MSGYKESTGNFWKPTKKGDSLEGLLINKETEVGPNKSIIYYIERLTDHEITQIWGTTILDQKMIPVKIGQQVLITYKGLGEKGTGGKQAPHIWKVEYMDVDLEAKTDKEIDDVLDS